MFDVIIVGLGAMGSAAACHLASRGKSVLGLERYTSPHDLGSSHGNSRIIRQAYYEDPAYVPLVLRAYDLWRRLERETGRELLYVTGGLFIGPPDGELVEGSARSAREYGLPHEVLDAGQLRRYFPVLTPNGTEAALLEKEAGFLLPEECIVCHLERAGALGAELRFEDPVLDWEESGDHVRVRSAAGEDYEAGHLVVTAGPWASGLLADSNIPLQVQRQVFYWFDPVGGTRPFEPDRFPVWLWETADGTVGYGFPAHEGPRGGAKVGFHHGGQDCTPETIDREVHDEEIARIRRFLVGHVPALDGVLLRAKTCMYTNTPDKHFVVSRYPGSKNVTVACGFSGHGFKFASVMGEILADLATEGETRHPIGLFSPARFAKTAT